MAVPLRDVLFAVISLIQHIHAVANSQYVPYVPSCASLTPSHWNMARPLATLKHHHDLGKPHAWSRQSHSAAKR